jgi:hypothetical protein
MQQIWEVSKGEETTTSLSPLYFKDTKGTVMDQPSDANVCGEQSVSYWNRLLRDGGLSEDQGKFMPEAPQGCGQLTSGGYDCKNLENVDAAQNLQTGHVKGANFCKRKFNGAVISSAGYGPDALSSPARKSDRAQSADTNAFMAAAESFTKVGVTLVCACGVREARELQLPEGVTAKDETPFSCSACNGLLSSNCHSRTKRRATRVAGTKAESDDRADPALAA